MVLNIESVSKILEIVATKQGIFDRFAPQEVQRISDVIFAELESLIGKTPIDPLADKGRFRVLAKNNITDQLNAISSYLGTKNFGDQLDVTGLVDMAYEVEFNTEKFLSQQVK
jgi:hypothetical protein